MATYGGYALAPIAVDGDVNESFNGIHSPGISLSDVTSVVVGKGKKTTAYTVVYAEGDAEAWFSANALIYGAFPVDVDGEISGPLPFLSETPKNPERNAINKALTNAGITGVDITGLNYQQIIDAVTARILVLNA